MQTLKELFQSKVESLGDEAPEFFGENQRTITAIIEGRKNPTFEIVQKLMEDQTAHPDNFEKINPDGIPHELQQILRSKLRVSEQADASEIAQAVIDGKWNRKVMMLEPISRDSNWAVKRSHMAMMRRCPDMGYMCEPDTTVQRARNILARNFLSSEAEWSFWVDSDTIPPYADPQFFKDKLKVHNQLPFKFASIMAADRLRSHGKTFVGGVYAQREKDENGDSKLCIQPALHPRGQDDIELVKRIRQGPSERIVQVGYLATGCCMVHRKVYEDIIAKNPALMPENPNEPFDFFGNDVGKRGEDVHFAKLAADACHPAFLDLAVVAVHIGNYPFMP